MAPAKESHSVSSSVLYRSMTRRRVVMLLGMTLAIIGALLLDFTMGATGLPLGQLIDTLLHPGDGAGNPIHVIVWDIRLPSALMAVIVGMALGLAGAEMQTILNNPLASPFTLGLSSAAAFGASLAIVLNIGIPGLPPEWFITLNAFVFAVISALLLDAVARWGGMSASGVVLFGIALVFSFNALVSLMQYIASAEALQGLVFWTMGSLSRSTWAKVGALTLVLALILPLSLRNAWKLTALRLGEDRAASFGIDLGRVRLGTLARISLLSALAVSFVGTIGFIGLVAPHIARRLFGEDHRFYLPGSALTGALILSMASVASKNIVEGSIVPVGIVTALVGIPFFLAVVLRRRLP
ncbi:FecCD family ABC transporter permease [Corticimicrobacter populi]|uniref:Iron-siderophore ABC transporter permease n=1 Tax=Corticimicrobacter populi TaxID=2175229 RepID=A0A2V1JVQ4_9BURK|nr:iron ABC transporter permease [Corticimicrobacter populi]PWF22278.1 iron-siderophore ABC transporter permease [Corticimicrobacter populi]QDQ86343.1 iron ABC transporter permease [Alcaligenaceae bacterium SJ-26]